MAAAVGRATKVPEIRKGDTVIVLAGKDAGKQGKVERVIRRLPSPTGGKSVYRRTSAAGGVKVVVEGLNIAKRHTKPRQSAGTNDRVPKMQQGGILDIPQPLPISRVMLVCTNCGKPTRIAHATLETGRRVRVCRHCSEQLEVKS
jgi:large subunit ribosomal protein L24